MIPPRPSTTVVLVTEQGGDDRLAADLFAGTEFAVNLVRGPLDPEPLTSLLADWPDAVCLLDAALCSRNDLLPRLVAAGYPTIVIADSEDAARDLSLIGTGAWDCLARQTLTPWALLKSVRRAVDHTQSLRAIKGTQAALAASERRFRSLVRNAVHGIFHTTRDGVIAEANPSLASMLGYDSETDLLNRNVVEFYADSRDRERMLESASTSETGRIPAVEVQWKRRDGALIWVRLGGRALEHDDGSVAGFEMAAEDVTEYRLLESQFRQAQKMEAVGRLAGGVAHDFNNLLTAMLGYAEILRDQIQAGDPRHAHVDEICKAAERGSSLTRQLLTFGRKPSAPPQTLDVNHVVRGFEKMLRRLIGEHIELRTVTGEGLGCVRADPGQLEQILMNLAINGRDAMPSGGRLTIETARVELGREYLRTHATAHTGPYVMVTVSDTGCGMSAEVKAHLFEPFFTTKESGKGSGLGLATVYGIVQQANGHIFVYSELGRGTSFKIYLPAVPADNGAGHPSAEKPRTTGGSETILVVEDEPSVRALTRGLLEDLGYRVLLANHGREALAVSNAYNGTIDLVLTDVVMPEMGGPDMVRHLWWTRPRLRVLYMSGYTEQTAAEMGLQDWGIAFLQKPFSPETLARAVRAALDQQEQAASS